MLLHKAWLVGVELDENGAENIAQVEERLNASLRDEFDAQIVKAYTDALNGLYYPFVLVSRVVQRSELSVIGNWSIVRIIKISLFIKGFHFCPTVNLRANKWASSEQ